MGKKRKNTNRVVSAEVRNDLLVEEENSLLPDFTDMEEVRKAFIMSEIFNRKY